MGGYFNITYAIVPDMLKVLCFGNPHFEMDSLALNVGEALGGKVTGVEFVVCGMDDRLLDEADDMTIVLDVVKGIGEVRFIGIEELKKSRGITAHDIDVGFYLRLLEKEGKRVKVIGIPEGMDQKDAILEVSGFIVDYLRTSR
ncbi:MAG: hypothetical protein ABIG39_06420 [Candidatus Micrarchaeota archaeon]